jgi:hypothetical protein
MESEAAGIDGLWQEQTKLCVWNLNKMPPLLAFPFAFQNRPMLWFKNLFLSLTWKTHAA